MPTAAYFGVPTFGVSTNYNPNNHINLNSKWKQEDDIISKYAQESYITNSTWGNTSNNINIGHGNDTYNNYINGYPWTWGDQSTWTWGDQSTGTSTGTNPLMPNGGFIYAPNPSSIPQPPAQEQPENDKPKLGKRILDI